MSTHGGGGRARQAPQGATVVADDGDSAAGYSRATLREVVGRALSDTEIAAIVGAQPGDHVVMRGRRGPRGNHPDVTFQVEGADGGSKYRRVYRHRDGQLTMLNGDNHPARENTGKGIGTRVFAAQVEALQRAGFDQIVSTGAGYGPENPYWLAREGRPATENGYYTLARWGYDAPLDHSGNSDYRLPPEFAGVATMNDLMRTPGGPQAWRTYGGSYGGRFDLHPGSSSLATLQAYLRERAARG